MTNTPSPSSSPCKQPSRRKSNLTSRHTPALTASCAAALAFFKVSAAKSGFSVLITNTTAAMNGILKGCSRVLFFPKKLVRCPSYSETKATLTAEWLSQKRRREHHHPRSHQRPFEQYKSHHLPPSERAEIRQISINLG